MVWDTSDGIDYEAGSGGLIQFCTFELNSDDGIDLDNEVDIVIVDNIIRNNNDDGIEIRMQGYSGPTLDIIISRNEIHGNGEDGIQLIHYDELTDRFLEITDNLIYNNTDAGIGMMDGQVTNEDFRAASIPETIYIFNNTFANNSHGITGGDNTVVLNNIFVDHPVIAVKNVDANSELAFNLYFNNGIDNSGSNVDVGSSVFEDPSLTANLELPTGSPAIDAGTASYSWQGATVLDLPPTAYTSTAPDIGAYEFDSGGVPPPDTPNLQEPTNGAENVDLTPTLVWSGDGDNFRFQIAVDASFVSAVDTELVSTTEYTVGAGTLDYSTTYFWRVNASNGGGTSEYSAPWSFTTEAASAPPDPPNLQSPTDGATDVPLQATLTWAGTADNFDVQVASDAQFTNVVFEINNTTSTAITLPPSTLSYGTTYYWHVRGRNTTFGAGDFSAPFAFTTVPPPDIEPPIQPQNLTSPAQTGTTIDLLWDATTDNVGVSFYNIYRDDVQIASESSTNHTAVGLTPATSYDFQVSAVDEALNESLLSDVLTVTTQSVTEPTMIDVRVAAASDDAEEDTSGGIDLTSSDLELVYAGGNQTVGMRFNGVAIPADATIADAYIQFQVDETTSPPDTSLTIEGQAVDNAPTFTSSNGDISTRARTTSVSWSPPPWPSIGAAGLDQRTPNIASIIQEIVNLSGWSSGNSLVIIITGTGERVAESYNGDSSGAPLLHVEFSTGPPVNQAPTVDAGPTRRRRWTPDRIRRSLFPTTPLLPGR